MTPQRENIQLPAGETFRLLRWGHSVREVELVMGSGKTVPLHGEGDHWHYHPACELTFITRGSGTRLVADHIERFEPGDLVLIGSNVPHYWQLRGDSAGLALQWELPLDHGIWTFNEAAPLRTLLNSALRGIRVGGITSDVIRQQMKILTAHSGLTRFSMFLRLLSILADAPKQDMVPLSEQPFAMSGNVETQEAIRRAVSYILAHYREDLSLSELLKLTGMSRATFARQFPLHVGKSFSIFRNQVRLQAVCQALQASNEPVGTIAFSHGFNQLSFFNRLFRREFGLNPSEYRAKATSRGTSGENSVGEMNRAAQFNAGQGAQLQLGSSNRSSL